MTCVEFEQGLPGLDRGYSFEHEEHLRTCPRCSCLASDLEAISQQARLLQASEEPSPRVWNSIESALREEGLIHPLPPRRSASALPRWMISWLAPVAAALLVASGVLLHQYQTNRLHMAQSAVVSPQAHSGSLADEDQLLNIVAVRGPAFRAAYESDLRAVDAYIHDAELSARNDPNDEIAQQYLMNAYEQRAMVYQMGMERSLP